MIFSRRSRRSRAAGTLAAAVALAMVAPALPGSAATPGAGSDAVPLKRLDGSQARPEVARPDGALRRLPTDSLVVQIELNTTPTARTFAGKRAAGLRAASSAAERQAGAVRAAQQRLVARLSAPATKADVLFTTSVLTSAVVVRTDRDRVPAIAALPGVTSVRPAAPKLPSNSNAVPLTQTPVAWEANGTGAGTNIAVLDTGIDYTHADFGGAGTEAAFEAADATDTVLTPDSGGVDHFPTAKVTGGYDLVGDDYNGGFTDDGLDVNSPNIVPNPDPNPLDCADDEGGGHGTHVAGTAAGFGVNADGSTYTGAYSTATPFTDLKIGPGTAPGATLSAYRVFGCTGASFVISQALDLIAATITDTNPNNDVDIMNLSLGADFTRGDDPDAQNIDRLALLGVTPVVAAGNAGDLYASTGSPGTARRALTVAATDDGFAYVDGLLLTAPPERAGDVLPGLLSVRYVFGPTRPGVTDVPLARPAASDSCSPYSPADAALVAGKVALIDAAGFGCGSVTKTANAREAGAVGAVIIADDDALSIGITGDTDIPAILIQASTGATLLTTPGVRVSINAQSVQASTLRSPDLIDTPAGFTSRGGTVGDGYLKPDLAAPGVSITSARSGSGDGRLTISGTSMATPHAAGIAALVKAAHPTFSAEQVKAAMVNTAIQDVVVDPTDTAAGTFTPSRVGSGRVRADLATATEVLAYEAGGTGSVSVGLGPIDVTAATQTITRQVTVQNTGSTARTYAVSTEDDLTMPGAVWTATPTSLSLAPSASATATLTLSLTRDALRKAPDPTREAVGEQIGLLEPFISESLGKLLLTPNGGGTQLRVAYGAAPRPASTTAAASTVTFPAAGGATFLPITGQGVSNGSTTEATSINSVVSGYQLQVDSPQLPACGPVPTGQIQPAGCLAFASQRAGDLRYVGATSTVPLDGVDDGLAVFGLATYGTWNTPSWNYSNGFGGDIRYRVFVDVDGDGTDDRLVDVERLADNTDLLTANLYDISGLPVGFTDDDLKASERADPSTLLDQQLLNVSDGSFDTNLLQSDVVAVPVSVAAMGLPAGRSTIGYRVVTESLDSLPVVLDQTARQSFDVAHPAVAVVAPSAPSATVLFRDRNGTRLPVRRDTQGVGSFLGLLLLHHHAANGKRAQVVAVRTGNSTTGPGCTVPASLTVSPSTIMAVGIAGVTVRATPGSTVDLYAYSRPSTTYRVARTGKVGANGTVAFAVRPSTNTRLYAQERGCAPVNTSTASKVLNVRSVLSINATRTGRRSYQFTGTVLPARPDGYVISLYRVEPNGRQVLTSQTRSRNGRYTINRTFSGTGRFGFVVRTGQDLRNAPGSSPIRSVLIY